MSTATESVTLPAQFGRYRIVRKLGEGGMGAVFLAHDEKLHRDVALKVCKQLDNPRTLERFHKEAEAAATLRHQHICPVYDYDVHDGTAFITMAYIDGPTLQRWAIAHPLDAAAAARLVAKLARAMQEAHEAGIIHRDLKPSNVVIDRKGEPVILDFGLARLSEAQTQTSTGRAVGTPSYMAPEQARGEPDAIGPRTDVYALGAILYELLTGEPPFVGTVHVVMAQVLFAEPRPPSRLRLNVPPALEAVCLRALAKDPARRHASMTELADALEHAAHDGPAPAERPDTESRTILARPAPAVTLPTEADQQFATPAQPISPSNALTRVEAAPGCVQLDLGGGVNLELVRIEPGEFRMGSPDTETGSQLDEDRHEVAITQPFYLGRFVVTQEQYVRITGKENPSSFAPTGRGRERVAGLDTRQFPVETVTWHEALDFCSDLMRLHGHRLPAEVLSQGYRFALPTEAQWEYACRADTRTPFSFGDCLNGVDANCDGTHPYGTEEPGPYLGRTAQVDSFPANPWGLFDMHGNVWQWCEDCYHEKFYAESPRADPVNRGKAHADRRVLRGGSWNDPARYCRSASRYQNAPTRRYALIGFRVCLRVGG